MILHFTIVIQKHFVRIGNITVFTCILNAMQINNLSLFISTRVLNVTGSRTSLILFSCGREKFPLRGEISVLAS